jgi:hypothetical protein
MMIRRVHEGREFFRYLKERKEIARQHCVRTVHGYV